MCGLLKEGQIIPEGEHRLPVRQVCLNAPPVRCHSPQAPWLYGLIYGFSLGTIPANLLSPHSVSFHMYPIYEKEPGPDIDYNELVKPILDKMVGRILGAVNPIKIILFGSYARRTPHRYSDVDLLVVFDDDVDEKVEHLKTLHSLKRVGIDYNVITITQQRLKKIGDDVGYIYYYALRDGVTLYER